MTVRLEAVFFAAHGSLRLQRFDLRETLRGAVRAPLRLLPRDLCIRVLTGPARGCRWIVGASNHGCWLGTYERKKARLFAEHAKRDRVVFIVGAHAGYYTLIAARAVGPQGRVLAFEPLPRNVQYLKQHVRLNRFTNVEILNVAVAREDSEQRFMRHESSAMGGLDANGDIVVQTSALDSICRQRDIKPDLIKIDVEGGETAVLEGAAEVLREARPSVFLATHGQFAHEFCVRFLESNAYDVEAIGTSPDELVAIPR